MTGQVQHLVDALTAVLHLQHAGLVAASIALLAGELYIGQELHLHRHCAVPFADVASSPGHVEGEVPGGISPSLGLGLRRKKLPDGVECLDIGNGIGARSAPDRRLVDENDVVQPLRPLEFPVEVRRVPTFILSQGMCHRGVEHVVHQGGFARSRKPR